MIPIEIDVSIEKKGRLMKIKRSIFFFGVKMLVKNSVIYEHNEEYKGEYHIHVHNARF